MLTKHTLPVELGTTPTETLHKLHKIKDACVAAILQKIALTGITGHEDEDFSIWEELYLEADFMLQQH